MRMKTGCRRILVILSHRQSLAKCNLTEKLNLGDATVDTAMKHLVKNGLAYLDYHDRYALTKRGDRKAANSANNDVAPWSPRLSY